MIKSLCPSQAFDEYTPDAWALVLNDVPYEDAREATRVIYRDHGTDAEWNRKIEADDIIRQVRKMRNARIEAGESKLSIPGGLDGAEYLSVLKQCRKRLGDGEHPATINRDLNAGELLPRDMRKLIEGAKA